MLSKQNLNVVSRDAEFKAGGGDFSGISKLIA